LSVTPIARWIRASASARSRCGREPFPHPAIDAFLDKAGKRPDWVDDELLKRGAEACRAFGMDAGLVLAYGSLLGGYRTAAALEPLVRTGRLAGGRPMLLARAERQAQAQFRHWESLAV
jgi:hypothetical protein